VAQSLLKSPSPFANPLMFDQGRFTCRGACLGLVGADCWECFR
jgi:hypothetical protein